MRANDFALPVRLCRANRRACPGTCDSVRHACWCGSQGPPCAVTRLGQSSAHRQALIRPVGVDPGGRVRRPVRPFAPLAAPMKQVACRHAPPRQSSSRRVKFSSTMRNFSAVTHRGCRSRPERIVTVLMIARFLPLSEQISARIPQKGREDYPCAHHKSAN
jgi:hypothetical protein